MAVLLGFGILTLAFADFIVLEQLCKPLAAKHQIPWQDLECSVTFFGCERRIFWWHVAFIPLGFALFALMGASARDWRIGLSGMVLFSTGWEDMTYYLIQGSWLPTDLPWLDVVPTVTWTRVLLREPHVSRIGLVIAAVSGAVIARLVLGFGGRLPFKPIASQGGFSTDENQKQ